MTLSALLVLAAMQLAIAASPGPATVLTIRTAAADGVRRGVALAFGLAVAIVVWAAAALAGLSALFALAPWVQTAMRVAGGLFLVWIAIGLWRGARAPMPEATGARVGGRTAATGLWTNLANPKALAYFTAVFGGLMPADPTAGDAALILGIVFAVEFSWYAVVAALFSRPPVRRGYARAKSVIERGFGVAVGAVGLRIATQP